MDIETRLALSSRTTHLTLFNEGMFVRFYNQSAYILNQLMSNNFKLKVREYKKLNGQPVIIGGFLSNSIASRLPNAKVTDFGFEVEGQYDLSGYLCWQAHRVAQARVVPTAAATSMPLGGEVATAQLSRRVNLSISVKQLAFLQLWEKGLYTREAEQNFIAGLQEELP